MLYHAARRNRCQKLLKKRSHVFLIIIIKNKHHILIYGWVLNVMAIFTFIPILIRTGNISGGRIQYVQLFSIVAIFILLIACINFMNLTTARSVKRAKEIGVRKVVGAVRFALIRQFIGEALLIVFYAVIISLCIVMLVLPQFNQLTGKQIHIPFNESNILVKYCRIIIDNRIYFRKLSCIVFIIIQACSCFKRLTKIFKQALWFRKGLVVFQFMLSIILIIGTIVVSKQVNYIQTINLGYDRENLLYIPLEGDLTGKYELFKNQALKMPGIKDITRMTRYPHK